MPADRPHLPRRPLAEHGQNGHDVRFDWGPAGAAAVGADVDALVVVDVLSFTTTMAVAVDRGTRVRPVGWDRAAAAELAARHDAVLAVGRSEARPGQVSLSPASVLAAPPTARLVLPSPNGSALAAAAEDLAPRCVGACLRNAGRVAEWLTVQRSSGGIHTVAVVAAGERWPDGSIRPAVEDLWGAGAVVAALADRGWNGLSPEAATAAAAYRVVVGREQEALLGCASGRELVALGHADDVVVAADVDAGRSVPVLVDGWFEAADLASRGAAGLASGR